MKIIKITIILLIASLSFASCDDYLDVNADVNNPSADTVTPELILPAAQNGSFSALSGTQNSYGNIMMNQWAGDVTNFTGGNSREYNYDINSTFYAGIWNSMYLATDKLQAIINKESVENVNYSAIAKILKVHNMQYIADIYGDAPYSEAFQRGQNYQPAYDSAFDIYKALYEDLDDAITKIANADITAINPGSADVMLNGDMAMWTKLANTLKLKLLVRASSSTDTAVSTWVASKFPMLASVSFLDAGENVFNNPGYVADTGKQNPFWNRNGFLTDGSQTTQNQFVVGSEYFVEFLKGTTPGFTADNRLGQFFQIASGSSTFQGIEQGADDPDDPSIGLSYIGSGLLRAASQDGWFFTSSESLLLQAEAVLNGNLAGDAQALFESAITDSFTLLGAGSAATYIDVINNTPVDLEAIITQKFIALHGTDGAEILIEHNRTGFPNPPLPLLTNDSHRPYRLMYPQSEFVGNSNNVIAITRAEVFTPGLFYQH